MGNWRKLGFVWKPTGTKWWACQYAHLPTPELIDEHTIRVYFAALDAQKYGRIGYVDVDAGSPTRVLRETEEPILDLGPAGAFDDSGVNPSCFATVAGCRCLYYIGWQRCQRVPYQLFTGLARPFSKGFLRASNIPVLDRTETEPFLRSAISILEEGGSYRAWYVSATGWTEVGGATYPSYIVRHAKSTDGRNWAPVGSICVGHESPDEFGIGRPWVVRDSNCYRMWYSIRSRSVPYRIGYAESTDGITWVRKDNDAGIACSTFGWDSEMICYAAVIDVNGSRLMFYNGNRHGATGFGVAILED